MGSSHLPLRYDDLYRLTLEFTDGKTGATRDTVVERSVGDFIDENGVVCQVCRTTFYLSNTWFLSWVSFSGYRGAPCSQASQVLVCRKERQIEERLIQLLCKCAPVPVD